MNKHATVIVTNNKKEEAQALLGEGFFDIPLKKGLRKYWVSSGPFLVEEYNAMVDSGLAFYINTDDKFSTCLVEQGMIKLVVEE